MHGHKAGKEKDGERGRQNGSRSVFAGLQQQVHRCLSDVGRWCDGREKPPLRSGYHSLSGGGRKEERKMDRAQL